MPIALESASPIDALDAVKRFVVEDLRMPEPYVREFPLLVHALARDDQGKWMPRTLQVGWLFAIVDSDEERASEVVIFERETDTCTYLPEGAADIFERAMEWAEALEDPCLVRLLRVPGHDDVFWTLDGKNETFFPLSHGFAVPGVEMAQLLKTLDSDTPPADKDDGEDPEWPEEDE